jgi:hypothetical protein
MTEAIDLDAFLPADTAELEIHRNDRPTGWRVTFAGPAHPKTIAWNDAQARRTLRRQAAIEQAQVNGRKWKPEDRDPAETRRENVEVVAARILDWTPIRINGREWSAAEATDLLVKPEMAWALGQMLEFLGAEASFTAPSGKP